jgi:hypothetical protein
VCCAPMPRVVCAAVRVEGFPTLVYATQQGGGANSATGRVPMGGAKQMGAAVDQPGSRRWTESGVVRQSRGESACDGSGWRIGGRSGV